MEVTPERVRAGRWDLELVGDLGHTGDGLAVDDRLASRLLGPWLRDIPASSILEAIRRLEESPVTDQVGGQT